VEKLWAPSELEKVEEQLKAGQRTKEMKGVLGLVVQLKAVLAGQAGADAKAKAKAEKKAKGKAVEAPQANGVKEKKRKSGDEAVEKPANGEKKEKKEKKAKKVRMAE